MKKAFTLIEVVLAVVLMSIIAFAILVSASNNTKLISFNESKQNFVQHISIFALNMKEDYHNKTKSLFDILDNKYKLDDETRKFLKKEKFLLSRQSYDTVVLEDKDVSDIGLSFEFFQDTIQGDYSGYIFTLSGNFQ